MLHVTYHSLMSKLTFLRFIYFLQKPSSLPSDEPSTLPSDEPSALPSDEPSVLPSTEGGRRFLMCPPEDWPVYKDPNYRTMRYPLRGEEKNGRALKSGKGRTTEPSLSPSDPPSDPPSDQPSVLVCAGFLLLLQNSRRL